MATTWPVGSVYRDDLLLIARYMPFFPAPPDSWTEVFQMRNSPAFDAWRKTVEGGTQLRSAVQEVTFRTASEPNLDRFLTMWNRTKAELEAQGGRVFLAAMWKRRIHVTIWPDNINLFGRVIPLPGPKVQVPTFVWEVKYRVFFDPLPLLVMAELLLAAAILAFVIGGVWLIATDRAEVIGDIVASPFRGATQALILFIVAGAVFSFAVYFAGRGAEGKDSRVSPPTPPAVPGLTPPAISIGPPAARIQTGIRGPSTRRR